jgi:hypothetical protein
MKKILFTFTVFSIAAAALLFTAGCNTVPASLPPVELLPGSQMQILLSDRNNKELAASAALLQHRLAEFPGIKSFIVTEQELKTPVFRTIFLGPVKELDAVGIDTAAAGEKTYGMIAVCGGDIFISGRDRSSTSAIQRPSRRTACTSGFTMRFESPEPGKARPGFGSSVRSSRNAWA